jgi:predicted acetyltransferase
VAAPVEVRPITADELADWVGAMHISFHSRRPPQPEADYRRECGQDLSRTLGAFDGQQLVGTYESFLTELTLPGGTCVTANAISAVTVLPTHHRRGLLTRMIGQDLRAACERGEAASILIAAEYPIYGRFGFGPATEQVAYRLPVGQARFLRAAPGSVALVQPSRMREVAPAIFDQVRRDWPGQISRRDYTWDTRVGLRESPWRTPDAVVLGALYTSPTGQPEGYLLYEVNGGGHNHVPASTLEVGELMAVSDEAYLGLWRYAAEVDLVVEITATMRRAHEPLSFLLSDPRKAFQQTWRNDFLWLRPMDTARVLSARGYRSAGQLVLEVSDPLGLSGGRLLLEASPDGATCRPTQMAADVRLGASALGALLLGGVSARVLQAAGLVEEDRPGALSRADALFGWPVAPWCSTFF